MNGMGIVPAGKADRWPYVQHLHNLTIHINRPISYLHGHCMLMFCSVNGAFICCIRMSTKLVTVLTMGLTTICQHNWEVAFGTKGTVMNLAVRRSLTLEVKDFSLVCL